MRKEEEYKRKVRKEKEKKVSDCKTRSSFSSKFIYKNGYFFGIANESVVYLVRKEI